MKIIINNKEREVISISILELIQELKLQNKFLAITKNGKLIKKTKWKSEKIEPNDKLDIFSPAGGG